MDTETTAHEQDEVIDFIYGYETIATVYRNLNPSGSLSCRLKLLMLKFLKIQALNRTYEFLKECFLNARINTYFILKHEFLILKANKVP